MFNALDQCCRNALKVFSRSFFQLKLNCINFQGIIYDINWTETSNIALFNKINEVQCSKYSAFMLEIPERVRRLTLLFLPNYISWLNGYFDPLISKLPYVYQTDYRCIVINLTFCFVFQRDLMDVISCHVYSLLSAVIRFGYLSFYQLLLSILTFRATSTQLGYQATLPQVYSVSYKLLIRVS